MAARERIIISDDDRFGRLDIEREPAPLLQLMPVFSPVGSGRREWEEAEANAVQYIPPRAREGRAA